MITPTLKYANATYQWSPLTSRPLNLAYISTTSARDAKPGSEVTERSPPMLMSASPGSVQYTTSDARSESGSPTVAISQSSTAVSRHGCVESNRTLLSL